MQGILASSDGQAVLLYLTAHSVLNWPPAAPELGQARRRGRERITGSELVQAHA